MNQHTFTRRRALGLLAAASAFGFVGCAGRPVATPAPAGQIDALQALERSHGGRLGVFALDTGSGRSLGWRADERFGMCSTFKLPLAAAVLREIEAGRLNAAEPIAFSEADLVPYAPVIQAKLDAGETAMSAPALAQAAQITSDNVAANLLIRHLGGPVAVTALWRAMGDEVTRLDRQEPQMNLVPAGEVRDTTTPRAMAGLVARLFDGALLDDDSRQTLERWLIDTRTGLRRLRAGLPAHWRAGDKTGTGIAEAMPNKINDVAVAWPPARAPIVIAAYYEADGHYAKPRPQDEAVLAQVGRIVATWAE